MSILYTKADKLYVRFLLQKYVIIALTLLLFSCQEDHTAGSLTLIEVDISTAKNVSISEIASSIEYVPLITNSRNYIFNDWLDVQVHDDRIYIQQDADVYDNYFAFKLDGKYVQQITATGEGVGKITNGSSYVVDGDELSILDSYQSKIIRYAINDGRYLGQQQLPYPYKKFVKTVDGFVFYMRNQIESNDTSFSYNLFSTDENFKLKQKAFKIPDYLRNYRVKEHNFSNRHDGKYLFTNFLSDVIYELAGTGMEPKYKVDFGDKWIDEESLNRLSLDNGRANRRRLLYSRFDHIYSITNLFHGERYVLLTFFFDQAFYWVTYRKVDGLVNIYKQKENDLDLSPLGEMGYWPVAYQDGVLFFLFPVEDVISRYQSELAKLNAPSLKDKRNNPHFAAYEKMVLSLPPTATAVLAKMELR